MSKERSCTSKVRYGHADTAYRAIQDMKAKHGSELESYECEFCGGWHIGHSKGKEVSFTLSKGFTRGELLNKLQAVGLDSDDVFNEVWAAAQNAR